MGKSVATTATLPAIAAQLMTCAPLDEWCDGEVQAFGIEVIQGTGSTHNLFESEMRLK